jgi:hypothetical protein
MTDEEKPPLFRSWRGWYLTLIIVLLVQIIFYYWLTRLFA